MRFLIVAIALGFFAVMALVQTTAEPQTRSLATATLPDADPVIVNQDTSPPFSRDRHDGVVMAPPTRRVREI